MKRLLIAAIFLALGGCQSLGLAGSTGSPEREEYEGVTGSPPPEGYVAARDKLWTRGGASTGEILSYISDAGILKEADTNPAYRAEAERRGLLSRRDIASSDQSNGSSPVILKFGAKAPETIETPQTVKRPKTAKRSKTVKTPETVQTKMKADGKRTALVIGNSGYSELRRLRNPRGDAKAVAARLRRLGFSVVQLVDADKRAMERALRKFGDLSQSAEISLVYFAGHGVQVDGKNYLLPVDARIRQKRDLNYETIELSTVLSELRSDKRANIIILDSCRDNPLAALYASNDRSIGASRGLAMPISSAIGTLIAFATAPNKVAADGAGRHSPYAEAFLRWVGEPGLEIAEVFRRVREDVVKATNGRQVPWENSSLIGGGIYLSAVK